MENADINGAIEQLQQMLSSDDGQSQIQNILSMFTNETEDKPSESVTTPQLPFGNTDNIDLNTLMKISSLMQAMNDNRDTPKTTFLKALKPFLKESRRNKLDQATKLIKMTAILKALKENREGGV